MVAQTLPKWLQSASTFVRPGNEDDWTREWASAAKRATSQAEHSKSVKNDESAHEAYLRASNYFRTAEFFRRENVDHDKLAQSLFTSSETCFEEAMKLSPFIYESITIQYDDTTLPGYFVSVDKLPRRTIIFNGGYDSTMSEGWFAIGAAALARGFNLLAFDGPGQGAAVLKQHLYFRPYWELVLSPVIDYALTRQEVGGKSMVVFGWSVGGYLVARAATREHRARVLVLDDGVLDFGSAFRAHQPSFVRRLVDQQYDSICNWLFGTMASLSTRIRWAVRNGIWTFGLQSAAELMRATKDYTLERLSQDITTPCLILDA